MSQDQGTIICSVATRSRIDEEDAGASIEHKKTDGKAIENVKGEALGIGQKHRILFLQSQRPKANYQ
jgi:hypothetical protein